MTQDQIREFIQGGIWESITTELRPGITKNSAGDITPFYLTREFEYSEDDVFACTVINYADPVGKVSLARIGIKGHLVWQGEHPLVEGAYKVDYVADIAYDLSPLHDNFAMILNKIAATGFEKWEINVSQSVKGRSFAAFGLEEGQVYVDYDLIYVYNDLLFNGSKNVDGRPFDKPANRPTNLQVPLRRKGLDTK